MDVTKETDDLEETENCNSFFFVLKEKPHNT